MLNHFNGREIKDASEVSRDWYKKIAKSEVAMKKLELRIIDCETSFKQGINQIVLRSPRRYQKLLVYSQKKKEIAVALADSLVELRVIIYDVYAADIVMPNLKKLVLDCDAMANGFIRCSKNLQELHLKSIRHAAIDSVIQCFKQNEV